MRAGVMQYNDVSKSANENPDLLRVVSKESVADVFLLKSVLDCYEKLQTEDGQMPARSTIDLVALQSFLQNIFLLEISGSSCSPACSYFYRVVGTHLREVFGEEMSMKCLDDHSFPNLKSHLRKTFHMVEEEKKTLVFQGALTSFQKDSDSDLVTENVQIILLPFSNDGQKVDHILGAIKF